MRAFCRTPLVTLAVLAVLGAISACAHRRSATTITATPPALLLGDFEDDYGGHFHITPTEFHQGARSVYHIVRWDVRGEYLIAHNDPANPSDGGRWTRFDWVRLDGMPPYEWGFCLIAYNAPTADAAAAVTTAKHDTPRTGCNGFPFSRMKRRISGAP